MGQGEWVDLFSNPGPWQTAYLVFYAIAAALVLRNFLFAARILRKKPGAGAIIAGIAAAAVAVGVFIAFIR
jgi:hypothetical protein